MSPLWSDMGLARAARAKAEADTSANWGKPRQADGLDAAARPVRRVLHPSWMSQAFRQPAEITR